MALLYDRLDNAIEDLKHRMKENPDENPDLWELSDLAVPVYASDVLALAGDIPAEHWEDGKRDKVIAIVEQAARNYYWGSLQRVARMEREKV